MFVPWRPLQNTASEPTQHIMKHFLAYLFVAATALPATTMAVAAPNPLSVHILDLQSGMPTPGVNVTLEQGTGDAWREVAAGVTDSQGRIPALYPADQAVVAGQYRVVFKTGELYAKRGQATFFPTIPVVFNMDQNAGHVHIPLLLSPFGYSTYRGN